MKRKLGIVLIVSLITALIVPSFLAFVSSSSGGITVNSKTASASGQQVQAGGNVNLFFGDVTWAGEKFYLFLSTDGSSEIASGTVYTPLISVYDVADTTATHAYSNNNGLWVTGSNWINGTIPSTTTVGNWFIKAVDDITSNVAVTDTYITVNPIHYNATLNVSPSAGPGGVAITFTGSGYHANDDIHISYYDPYFNSWNYMTETQADNSGMITVTSEAPDLGRSLGAYDGPETYDQISYRSQEAITGIVYSYATYNEYLRGLKSVGDQTASGLFGNGTSLSNVRTMVGDTLTLSGKWFHSNSPIYVRWDGVNVVGTVTSDQWLSAQVLGITTASANGSFSISVTIPNAEAGLHSIAVEDSSQARLTVKIFVSKAYLQLSPAYGPGGANVQFTGSLYPHSSTVDLYYLGTFGWNYWTNTTSDSNGVILVSAEMPDLGRCVYNEAYSNSSYPISFKAQVGNVSYAFADYNEYDRGLKQVGNQIAYGLYGNGVDLSSAVSVKPGDSLPITGNWFHPGVIYVRFDGSSVIGTLTSDQWLTAQVIGTTTASSTGSFSTSVAIPSASGGTHYLAIEDSSQTRLIVKINVDAPQVSPTAAPTDSPSNPTPQPTPNPNLPTPTIELSCKSTTISSGFKVEINGALALGGSAIADQPVLVSYSRNGGDSWESLTLVQTESDGSFEAVWIAEVSGNYLVKATVEATSTMNSAVNTVNMAIAPDPENNVFTLNSNSTIRQFEFNPESKELSFTAEGPSGTHGYVEIYIPKAILNDLSQLRAYLDDTEISFNSQSQGDVWLISFSYSHSTHRVTMMLGGEADITQEPLAIDPLLILVPVVLIAVLVAVAVLAIKRRRGSNSITATA